MRTAAEWREYKWQRMGVLSLEYFDQLVADLSALEEHNKLLSGHASSAGEVASELRHTITVIDALLDRLYDASDVYSADQSGAKDSRCGFVQPISVAEGRELNDALAAVRAYRERSKG